ncbi:MAG: UbiD family decarboxylase, partial [Sulfurovum sp.]|nr:UbiD family decarboxylase [Sulfurovum sp.]
MKTNNTVELLKANDLLRVINDELDIYLEIPHIAYVEVKQETSKALLFTNVVDKKNGKKFDTPILMNGFCSPKAVELLIGDGDAIGHRIQELLH